ncbi:unnamed protein product [Protopolystoma xenopodis]|uniref:Uncharacterized protein n=1 Tax=Protopolystoma xenopodis TaxID=117903 RepID=A0A3S5A964_9PLAT|nr:unnamed protein product [Protopolystoma xenopodis]
MSLVHTIGSEASRKTASVPPPRQSSPRPVSHETHTEKSGEKRNIVAGTITIIGNQFQEGKANNGWQSFEVGGAAYYWPDYSWPMGF